jgi:hypothetical protein
MSGEKIHQLQDSMFTVLESMRSQDFFSIITFHHGVTLGHLSIAQLVQTLRH